jgi:hypothetical protein
MMRPLALLYAGIAAAMLVIVGVAATSRVDFALGIVCTVLILVGWDAIERGMDRPSGPVARR